MVGGKEDKRLFVVAGFFQSIEQNARGGIHQASRFCVFLHIFTSLSSIRQTSRDGHLSNGLRIIDLGENSVREVKAKSEEEGLISTLLSECGGCSV